MGHGGRLRLRDVGRAGLEYLTEFVFPATCGGCGAAGSWMCQRCESLLGAIDLLDSDSWQRRDSMNFTVMARYVYADPVRRSIHLLKYGGEYARAGWFADQLAPLVGSSVRRHSIIEPVPLTERRERNRGFNQSREIAARLSESMEIPVGSGLARIRETRPQVELDGLERVTNVRGAFSAGDSVAGKQVILIDDVVTTGSTLRECAAACYLAGAAVVIGVAVASGVG